VGSDRWTECQVSVTQRRPHEDCELAGGGSGLGSASPGRSLKWELSSVSLKLPPESEVGSSEGNRSVVRGCGAGKDPAGRVQDCWLR
jgi:hypothetical protein